MQAAIFTVILLSLSVLFVELSAVNPAIFNILARNIHGRNPYSSYNPYNPFSIDGSRNPGSEFARRRKWHLDHFQESESSSSAEEMRYSEGNDGTEASVEGEENAEEASTEGVFMRKIVMASGAHIVRDSWCLVSDSNNCIPAL
ncbi:uncharacterized protein LOC100898612 [Galendromus occidentalis]|uniref:Uncharacterized protein LOC100898612 n=1 Tax=Galendromus occidentalis TaxID=34638 RepID=A0AAJ6VZJ4_9ACAR|nr:uncharacterized protein LOC100898612 [Galendromus occidentalis]